MPLLDGLSLNVILKNPIILLHPPFLYISLACVCVLFWFVILTVTIRTISVFYLYLYLTYTLLVCLLFCSIVLGGFWAYYVLGWGGW